MIMQVHAEFAQSKQSEYLLIKVYCCTFQRSHVFDEAVSLSAMQLCAAQLVQ